MSQSVREIIIDWNNSSAYVDALCHALLARLEERMPKKQAEQKEGREFNNVQQANAYIRGRNTALAEVRRVLREELIETREEKTK